MAATKMAPATTGVNFGDLGMYTGGQFIPDGDYILYFNVIMHQATDKTGQAKGPRLLGCMVDLFHLSDPKEETKLQKFYSMGGKADQSFAPNADTGKGLVAIPGAVGGTLNDKTNWYMLVNSLYQSGLPQGVFSNDLTVIDGVHVHITNVDEPADRAGFQSNTAEIAGTPRLPGKVPVVTEIKEGGAPWEGGGGMAATTAKTGPAPKPVAKPLAKPEQQTPATETDEDIRTAALNGIGDVFMLKPAGMPRVALRNEAFKAVKKATKDEAIASAVIAKYFEPGKEEALSSVLGELGYSIQGNNIKPTE